MKTKTKIVVLRTVFVAVAVLGGILGLVSAASYNKPLTTADALAIPSPPFPYSFTTIRQAFSDRLSLNSSIVKAMEGVLTETFRRYAAEAATNVRVDSKQGHTSWVYPPLSEEIQTRLETAYDSALIDAVGRDQAEDIKFLTIRFLYLYTGAFGYRELTITSLDKGFVRFQTEDAEIEVDSAGIPELDLLTPHKAAP